MGTVFFTRIAFSKQMNGFILQTIKTDRDGQVVFFSKIES
ncbi:hypothetical protein P872_23485 [Rhodonellum psychrophilum GCM71 = DSM 17998]|uniref:Uncharacterized protein n=1 Tax=Rhodonellum psychrophilum GCM71 = DSM 17998 TaxID=1123057 RepID=U5BVJ8_9BACT|nr:hypothetical protein P872_23485 [Rhodonellum psychrophilum GCM71 = DSM 17998]